MQVCTVSVSIRTSSSFIKSFSRTLERRSSSFKVSFCVSWGDRTGKLLLPCPFKGDLLEEEDGDGDRSGCGWRIRGFPFQGRFQGGVDECPKRVDGVGALGRLRTPGGRGASLENRGERLGGASARSRPTEFPRARR